MTQGRCIIRLHRRRGPWRDRLRDYRVRIDGVDVGAIAQGETKDFFVQPGQHRVRLTIDRFFTSAEKTVWLRDSDPVVFMCGPGGSALLTLFALLLPRRYIKLDGPVQSPSHPPFPEAATG